MLDKFWKKENKIEIIPAIIPKNIEDLKNKLSLISGLAPFVQIDILDGVFVSEENWSFFSTQLPFQDVFNFELDLMIKNFGRDEQKKIVNLDPERVVVHFEAFETKEQAEKIINQLKEFVKVGIAFNINTSVGPFESLLNLVNFVQLMGVERIGFQGESFSEKVIQKIKDLRIKNKKVIISIDGGVNLDNAPKLISAGVNRLVVGSAIFESDDVKKTIEEFKKLVRIS